MTSEVAMVTIYLHKVTELCIIRFIYIKYLCEQETLVNIPCARD